MQREGRQRHISLPGKPSIEAGFRCSVGLGEAPGAVGRPRPIRVVARRCEDGSATAATLRPPGSCPAPGAQLFFWAWLAYAVVYVAGIAWLRTAVWPVCVIGRVLIFLQLA